jgi:hypothetical protein
MILMPKGKQQSLEEKPIRKLKRPHYFLRPSKLRWEKGSPGIGPKGPPGIEYLLGTKGAHEINWRDTEGEMRGQLLYADFGGGTGELFMVVQTGWRRRGIATALLAEADLRGLLIDFENQEYSYAGWLTVRRYLNSEGRPPVRYTSHRTKASL